MVKFLFGIALISYGFFRTLVHDPVWGLYLFAALTHIRLAQLSENYYLPLQIPIVIASLTVLLYLSSAKYPKKFSRWPLEVWLLGFMIVGMAYSSSKAAFNPQLSWDMTFTYFKYWVFFLLFIQLVDSFEKIRNFHNVLILSACWLVYRCYDLRGTTGARFENINGGSIGDSNHFAAALVLLFPFVFQRVLSKNKAESLFAGVLCFGIVMSVFITGSRGGLLGMGALFVLLFMNFKQYRKKMVMALVVLCLAISPFINDYHIARFKSLVEATQEETRERSAQSRLDFWRYSFELFKNNPVSGVGLANFGYYSGPALEGMEPGQRGHVAHSTWFEILAEGGALVFIPFVVLLVNFFRKTKRILKVYLVNNLIQEAQHVIALRVGLGAFLVNATFLNRLIYEPIYWCIALGIAHGYLVKSREAASNSETRDPAETSNAHNAFSG